MIVIFDRIHTVFPVYNTLRLNSWMNCPCKLWHEKMHHLFSLVLNVKDLSKVRNQLMSF